MSSALSALAGTIIGGVLSLLAPWMVNQRQVRAQWLSHDRERREDVYKDFIEQATKCYIGALLDNTPDVSALVVLYAKLSRMRVLSSKAVIERGDDLIKKIIATYSQPNKSFSELPIGTESFDLIRDFSEACRAEFHSLREQTL